MTKPIELEWRYRSTRDSEYAMARHKGFEILVQDCDGDMSRWHIKRGDQYLAMDECGSLKHDDGNFVYHMDHAMVDAEQVFNYIWRAVEFNDFVRNELPKLKAIGEI